MNLKVIILDHTMQATSVGHLTAALHDHPYASALGLRMYKAIPTHPAPHQARYAALISDPLSVHLLRLQSLYQQPTIHDGSHTADEETIPSEVQAVNEQETPSANDRNIAFVAASSPSLTTRVDEEEDKVAIVAPTSQDTPMSISHDWHDYRTWLLSFPIQLPMSDRPKKISTEVNYTALVSGDATPTSPDALEQRYDDAKYQARIYKSILLDDAIASPQLAELLSAHGHIDLADQMHRKIRQIDNEKNAIFAAQNQEEE